MIIARLRLALLICAIGSAAALGVALASETYGGLVPCALCLVERWPYRIAIVVSLIGLALPRRWAWWALGLSIAVLLAAAASGVVHVGVEQGWWPSPLPECAAPNLSGLSISERLARMPAHPSKPCDDPTYLISWLPISMAEMNVVFAVALGGALATFALRKPGKKPMTDQPLPGDLTPRQDLERIIRVDHAGEYGAARIYAGQIAVLGRGPSGDVLRHMKAQEQVHLDTFAGLIATRRVRPTALLPIWNIAGFALGAITAAMGEKAAMACTVAVEETIDTHYAAQSARLGEDEAPLRDTIEVFRAEELEHRDIGLDHGAEQAFAYRLLTRVIKVGCKVAIEVSERI